MTDEKIPVCAAVRLPHPKKTLFQLPRPRRCSASKTSRVDGYYRRRAATADKMAALARREAAEAKKEAALAHREVAKVPELVRQLVVEEIRRRAGAAATIAAAIRGLQVRRGKSARSVCEGAAAILAAAIRRRMAWQECAVLQVKRHKQYSAAPRLAALIRGRKVREQLILQRQYSRYVPCLSDRHMRITGGLWALFERLWSDSHWTELDEHFFEVFIEMFQWADRHVDRAHQVYGGSDESRRGYLGNWGYERGEWQPDLETFRWKGAFRL